MPPVLVENHARLEAAAQFLNVSVEHLMRLLRDERLSLDKLMEYKQKQAQISEQALQDLAAQAQELNMGY